MTAPLLWLASTSPRRLALLQQIGLHPRVLPIAVDETALPDETPEACVVRLARAKAEAGLRMMPSPGWVLAADTVVVAAGRQFGKPASLAEARDMWRCLPSPDHRVLTAVAVAHAGELAHVLVATRVDFMPIPSDEQDAYWVSGEPADKAGGYAIQGRAAIYVRGIEGSYSNVVGLPLAETAELLRASHFPLWG